MSQESPAPPPENPPPPAQAWEPAGPPPPPSYPPQTMPARGSQRPLLFALGAVGLVILLVIAYVAVGLIDAEAKLTNAQSTYNTVIHHQNSIIDKEKALVSNLSTSNVTTGTSATTIQQDKATVDQIIGQAKNAQPQIAGDNRSLTSADTQLRNEGWLTVFSRSRLDRQSKKDGYLLAALADSKKISDDYVQVGPFLDAFLDVTIDVENIGTKATAKDISGMSAANEKLKADIAKAIQTDKAPGMPPEMDTFLHLIQAFSTDIANLVNALGSSDSGAFDSANASLQTDTNKLADFDYKAMSTKIEGFYQGLIDAYNSDIDKANKA